MGTGYLTVNVYTANEALPVGNARVVVTASNGTVLYNMTTDAGGSADTVPIEAPDKYHSLNPNDPGPYYSTIDTEVSADGYNTTIVRGSHIYDTITFILPINLTPFSAIQREVGVNEFTVPPNAIEQSVQSNQDGASDSSAAGTRVLKNVVIPNNITVHLGLPSAAAQNVQIPFKTYIKNVATHEIHDTWLPAALEANILCEITYALNRIYSEWYPSKGYSFDITNTTQYDQFYVYGDGYAANIGVIVDRIFNQYVRRAGRREPYFTRYCNGVSSTCPGGLSQWGSQSLAQSGYSALQILRYYYPDDVEVVETNNISDNTSSYPGYTLSFGSSGENVTLVQRYLNRIRTNFPNIPQIGSADGILGQATSNAVIAFQRQFGLPATGNVDKATWYEISRVYAAVIRLAELDGEGQFIGVGASPPTSVIRQGNTGSDVAQLQFLLNYIGQYYPSVPSVIENSSFDSQTVNAVKAFQSYFGLTADGVVGPATWNMLYNVYKGIQTNVPSPPIVNPPSTTYPYPGYLLQVGSSGSDVLTLQRALNYLSASYPEISRVAEDGQFGNGTRSAVIQFQNRFGLTPDGIVGPATWNAIMGQYSGNVSPSPSTPAYPGYLISQGSSGSYVTQIQNAINTLSAYYPSIPRVTADGVFGSGTAAAVRAFQLWDGLTADGIVGASTWNSLMQNAAEFSSLSQPSAYSSGYQTTVQSVGNRVPVQYNNSNQVPVQYNNGNQAPVQYNNSNQVPVQYNNSNRIPVQYNNGDQAPVQYCADGQAAVQYNNGSLPSISQSAWIKPILNLALLKSLINQGCGYYR
ncbi:MAG: peptidoglycan-binding protein [Clostridiales bacterium]|jgi:peptidoglycan hydrolase-like protein with peptidoglycan-binding domain|nr:peptidoglycan-binding protein [Clostridiales bacterium]